MEAVLFLGWLANDYVRSVPCRKRVTNLEDQYAEETEVEDGAGEGEEEAWLATHSVVEGKRSIRRRVVIQRAGINEHSTSISPDGKVEDVEDISSTVQSVSPSGQALRVNLMSAIVEEDHFGDEPVVGQLYLSPSNRVVTAQGATNVVPAFPSLPFPFLLFIPSLFSAAEEGLIPLCSPRRLRRSGFLRGGQPRGERFFHPSGPARYILQD